MGLKGHDSWNASDFIHGNLIIIRWLEILAIEDLLELMGEKTFVVQILDLLVFSLSQLIFTCRLNHLSIWVTGSAEARKKQ